MADEYILDPAQDMGGQSYHNLDSKKRIIIPQRFRDIMGDKLVVSVPLTGDHCLVISTAERWKRLFDDNYQLVAPAMRNEFRRASYAMKHEPNMEANGRIGLREEFCAIVGLTKEVVLTGAGDHLEVWDAAEWNEKFGKPSINFAQFNLTC